MIEDFLLRDEDAEVFDNDLGLVSDPTIRQLSSNRTSLRAEPSIASLWKRLCCAVM